MTKFRCPACKKTFRRAYTFDPRFADKPRPICPRKGCGCSVDEADIVPARHPVRWLGRQLSGIAGVLTWPVRRRKAARIPIDSWARMAMGHNKIEYESNRKYYGAAIASAMGLKPEDLGMGPKWEWIDPWAGKQRDEVEEYYRDHIAPQMASIEKGQAFILSRKPSRIGRALSFPFRLAWSVLAWPWRRGQPSPRLRFSMDDYLKRLRGTDGAGASGGTGGEFIITAGAGGATGLPLWIHDCGPSPTITTGTGPVYLGESSPLNLGTNNTDGLSLAEDWRYPGCALREAMAQGGIVNPASVPVGEPNGRRECDIPLPGNRPVNLTISKRSDPTAKITINAIDVAGIEKYFRENGEAIRATLGIKPAPAAEKPEAPVEMRAPSTTAQAEREAKFRITPIDALRQGARILADRYNVPCDLDEESFAKWEKHLNEPAPSPWRPKVGEWVWCTECNKPQRVNDVEDDGSVYCCACRGLKTKARPLALSEVQNEEQAMQFYGRRVGLGATSDTAEIVGWRGNSFYPWELMVNHENLVSTFAPNTLHLLPDEPKRSDA